MESSKVLNLAADAGKIILENGGETYRVEETIVKICDAFGAENAESYVTPTGIMISITDLDGHTTSLVKRIHFRTVNLEKISRVNDLARKIKFNSLSAEYVKEELNNIEQSLSYSSNNVILFSAFSAASFTLLYGGNVYDFITSFFIGALIKWLSIALSKLEVNEFFINTLGGAISALIALISVKFGLATHVDTIVIGSIMLLVPGLAITNAIRDTISGDLIAGIARGIEAFLIAIAIAVGTGIVLRLGIVLLGGSSI